ncbi:MAG: hypothetical protein JST01_12895 [Cyanobacteria bacterium SZAS TMP-1]|nr:hypothetical protein [Cyanobacteria bacterium SZAS TMP-1]
MKSPRVLALSLSLVATCLACAPVSASDSSIRRLDQNAAEAFAAQDYRKAESQWLRLLDKLNNAIARSDEKKELTEQVEATQRHLGECALAEKNYDQADELFSQARNTMASLGSSDPDLERDQRDLQVNYRLVDLNNLGGLGPLAPFAMAALGDFRPNKVSVARTDTGHHVCILLADDVIKQIGNRGVTEVGVSKKTSFDLQQGDNGEITLSNIVGVKVHATVWVNIINSCIKKDETQRPIAIVTAQKMGISQSVKTPIPNMIYLPVLGLVSQVKDLFNDGSAPGLGQTIIASPAAPTQPTGDTGYGIAPVWNNGNPQNQGAVIPLPAAQGQSMYYENQQQMPQQYQQQASPQYQQQLQQQYPPQYQQPYQQQDPQ